MRNPCRAKFARDGNTFRDGDCVGVLDGKIVNVADNATDATSALRRGDNDSERGMIVEVGPAPVDVTSPSRAITYYPSYRQAKLSKPSF